MSSSGAGVETLGALDSQSLERRSTGKRENATGFLDGRADGDQQHASGDKGVHSHKPFPWSGRDCTVSREVVTGGVREVKGEGW